MFNRIIFRSKLLFSFLFFIILILAVAISGYWFYQKRDDLGNIYRNVEESSAKLMQVIQYEKDFLLYESVNQQYFKSNKSEYLDQREKTLKEVKKDLKNIRISASQSNLNLVLAIDSILYDINHYEVVFNEMVDLIKTRGFRDYGLEGEMRNYAHQLENGNYSIDKTLLLSLRRHEKDYILRKDTIYINKLEKTAVFISNNLNSQKQTLQTDSAKNILLNYLLTFRKLVKVEKEMGLDNFSGMRKKLHDESFIIQNHLKESVEKNNHQFYELVSKLKFTFLIIIIFAILLAVALTYIFTKQILKPVRQLSDYINQNVSSDFSNEFLSTPLPIQSEDELGNLSRNFIIMNGKIYNQLNELKARYVELQSINIKLVASENRLTNVNSVKDKFFAILSHDMKGPLNTLTGFLELLRDYTDTFTKAELIDFASSMNTTVKRLISMLENLLHWSRSQSGSIIAKPESLNLNIVIDANLWLLNESAKNKKIKITTIIKEDIFIDYDKNMLDFTLRNLISNAIKFTPVNGRVEISAEKEFNYVNVSIKDTGIGISTENLEKLFKTDVHFTTHGTERENGTGFGLLMCKFFVEKNNGKIFINSLLDKGTTVTFTIPTNINTSNILENNIAVLSQSN